MINAKMVGLLVAAFVAGSFFASPVPAAIAAVIATDVQCTGCVGTADLAGNAITAAKIKDNEVKAAEIATDAVGAAEIQGVTKLLFGQCVPTTTQKTMTVPVGQALEVTCNITGVDGDDSFSATLDHSQICFEASSGLASTDKISVFVKNDCSVPASMGSNASIAVIVFDK
jgi:hypothetical protein